jgi:large subunit ribosomal protein L21
MYAIVQSGGHQYRVAQGDTIEIQRLEAPAGAPVEFREVLLVGGDTVRTGTPFVEGAVVRATVVGETRGPKLTVFKYKPKNRYRIKTGHRQRHTQVMIDAIEA